jgi:hypothetical protein
MDLERLTRALQAADAAGDTAAASAIAAEIRRMTTAPQPTGNAPQAGESRDAYFARLEEARASTPVPEGSQAMTDQARVAMARPGGSMEQAGRALIQGTTFGFGDELTAALAAMSPNMDYGTALQGERDRLAQQRENAPVLSYGSEIAGAIASPAGLMGNVGKAITSTGGRIAAGAGLGGLLSAIYGFGSGEDGAANRSENAMWNGLLGAGIGAAVPAAGNLVSRLMNGRATNAATAGMARTAPTVDDLQARAGALYDEARQLGITATQQDTQALQGTMTNILTDAGLISPTGRMATSYPKISDAMNMVDDYALAEMNPTQMQQVRRLLQAAAQSADPNESRIGTQMIRAFDNFTDPLAPQFREANRLWRDAAQGDLIQKTIELAGIRAGQYTGSGFENALRTEFRSLARQITRGTLNVSEDMALLINRIASGGAVENLARDLGKAAPRGVVSTGLAGGVPFMVGNAVGGPGLGILAGGAALTAGEIGRRAATAMQTRNAGLLDALARSGGVMPQVPALPPGSYDAGLLRAVPALAGPQ